MHDHKSYWTKKLYCHTHGHQLTSPQTVKRKTRLLRHIHVRANQSKCGSRRCETPCRQQRTLLARGWRKMAKGRNAKSANTKSDHYWLAGRNPPLKSTPGCLPCGGELFMMRPKKVGWQITLKHLISYTSMNCSRPFSRRTSIHVPILSCPEWSKEMYEMQNSMRDLRSKRPWNLLALLVYSM